MPDQCASPLGEPGGGDQRNGIEGRDNRARGRPGTRDIGGETGRTEVSAGARSRVSRNAGESKVSGRDLGDPFGRKRNGDRDEDSPSKQAAGRGGGTVAGLWRTTTRRLSHRAAGITEKTRIRLITQVRRHRLCSVASLQNRV